MKKSKKTALIAATLSGTLLFTGCKAKEPDEMCVDITYQVAYGIMPASSQLNDNSVSRNSPGYAPFIHDKGDK